MRTPLAHTIFCGVILILFTAVSVVKVNAQTALTGNYLEIWDQDSNEKITHAEFYEGMSSALFFEAWDSKKDAKIDRQEFYAGLESMRSVASGSASLPEKSQIYFYVKESSFPYQQDFSSVFKDADLNRNGSLNKGEFYTFIFRQLDEDQNGMLSYLEASNSRLAIFSTKSW